MKTSAPSCRRARLFANPVALALALAVAMAPVGAALAQQQKYDPDVPLIVINAASVERLLNQAVATFEAAGRPELAETLGDGLARVNDLKGLDRTQSVGVMVFLNGLLPEAVAYVPVKDIDELMKTAQVGPITVKKVADDRFELVAQRQTLHLKVVREYAFLSNSSEAVDRKLPDPVSITRRLTGNYDLGASISLAGVAPETRDLVMNLLRANAENDLQRRDDEPESLHRLRKAAGERNLELLELLIRQGQHITIGWSVSGEEKVAAFEVLVVAQPGSEYAAYFNELKGARSRFVNLLNAQNPMSASVSWMLDKPTRKMFREVFTTAEQQLFGVLGNPGDAKTDANPIQQLVEVLTATTDQGHIDACLQFVGKPPGPFVFVGGMKVAESGKLAEALEQILARVDRNRIFRSIRLNASAYKGINFHRLEPEGTGEPERVLYGENMAIYLGTGENILWLAVGGDAAVQELKRAIDRAEKPLPENAVPVPMQVVMNFSQWMDIFDPNQRAEGFGAIARNAFRKGGDALRLEVLPVEDGVRFRAQFDEAFLRLAGQAIARGIDRRGN